MALLVRLCLLTLALPLTFGCQTDRYSLGSSLAAEQSARIVVLGSQPRIEVENLGPGPLTLRLEGPSSKVEPLVLKPDATTMQTLAGPVNVLFSAAALGCSYKLTAFNCGGLRVDVIYDAEGE